MKEINIEDILEKEIHKRRKERKGKRGRACGLKGNQGQRTYSV